MRKSQSPFNLLEAVKSRNTSCASIRCMSMVLPPVILPSSIRLLTKYAAHFADERCIEADLLHPVHDAERRGGDFRPIRRRNVNHNDVTGFAFIDQREERRIPRIAAIPIIFAVNFDS